MKHKMWSRLLSMMLAVMMIASIVPNSAFAEAASEIAASSQATSEVQVEEVPLPEDTTTEEPAAEIPAEEPAAETPAEEPVGEPAPSAEPVAEPTAEPATESEQPTAAPSQAPAETAVPSEQPSAEPSAAPEGTETPEGTAVPSETPAASATPAPSESPVPSETPAPSEEPAIDGQALLDELMAIEDDEAFMQAVSELTEEQTAALEALGEEALADYALRVESLTAPEETPISELRGEELVEKLMELSDEEFMTQIGQLTQEQIDSLMQLDEALLRELDNRFSQLNPDQGTGTVAAPFTSVGPIAAWPSFMMNKSPALFSLKGNSYVNPIDGLIVDKNVTTYDEANEIFKIELSAEAESNIVETSIPCDIILVLDRSGSMAEDGKAASLKAAAKNFVDTVQQNSPESRIAVVAYSDNSRIYSGNGTAEGAFVSVSDKGELYIDIDNAMSAPDGGTYSNEGLHDAYDIYQAIPSESEEYANSRAVIMFTDGIPGDGSWPLTEIDSRWDASTICAQSAIHWSRALKEDKGLPIEIDTSQRFYGGAANDFDGQNRYKIGCGATVYTVAVFPNTDEYNKDDYWWETGTFTTSDADKINEYMYRVSSHRKNGSHVGTWPDGTDAGGNYPNKFTRNQTDGYYLVGDTGNLNDIFQQIANQTGKPIENTTIKDYISPYFQLVNEQGEAIELGSTIFDQEGRAGTVCKDDNGIYVEWTEITLKPETAENAGDEQTFEATLYIKPKAEFMGGTNVPTNIYGISGVYSNDECIGSFKECVANVRVKNEYNVQDQSIYITNNANISSMIVGNENGPRPFVSFGGGAYSNDFVETVYTVKGSDGKIVGTWTFEKGKDGVWKGEPIGPDECSQYTVSCTVENTSIPSMDEKNNAWVHVFTPTVTWKDSSQDYNTVLNEELLKGHAVKTEWSDKHSHDTAISGTAPDISFEFAGNIVDQPIQQNLDVKVSKVLIAGQDKTERVSFAWEKGADCPGECTAAPENAQFRIHLKTGDLTITKTLKGDATAAKQETFLFQITGAGKTYYASVVLGAGKNSGDTVVKNLPAGSYTVEEILCPKGYALESSNPDNGTVFVSGADALIEFVNTVTTNPDDPTKDDSMAINRFSKDQNGEWTWDWANKPSDSSQ